MKRNAIIPLFTAAFTMPLLIGLTLGLPRRANAQSSTGEQTANLSQDQPLQVEDAEPTESGQFQFQFTSRYDRTAEREDSLTFLPGIQYGFGHGWQSTLQVRALAGNLADKSGSGEVDIDVLKQLTPETARGLPAFALEACATLPSGQQSRGYDTWFNVIATRSLSNQINKSGSPRLHLNVAWSHNDRSQPGELHDGYKALLAFSEAVRQDSAFVADVYREQDPQQHETENVAEVGWIQQVAQQTQVALGLGAGFHVGLGESSPRYRLSFSVQQAF